jgi:hypothetical protein
VPAVRAAQSAPPLDLNRLKTGLKDTQAIGLFSKLTLKNQMDDRVYLNAEGRVLVEEQK